MEISISMLAQVLMCGFPVSLFSVYVLTLSFPLCEMMPFHRSLFSFCFSVPHSILLLSSIRFVFFVGSTF